MATFHLLLDSKLLEHPTDVNIFIPEGEDQPAKRPVLWLLHGMYGCYSDWGRLTSVERYASAAGLAVVMPSADNSFYEDMAHGVKYYSYLTEELPERLRALLPLSEKRADNYIAGLSMGGYGAMKLALRHPERYAAAASFSGVVDIQSEAAQALGDREQFYRDIFGDTLRDDCDPFKLLQAHVASGTKLPDLYSWCGTEDFLYAGNVRFRDLCRSLSVPLSYHEAPGNHEWGFWDMAVREFIAAIGLRR